MLVTGSNDFAVGHEITFHGRAVPGGERILYQPIRTLPRRGTDWLIVRREMLDPEPASAVEDPHGNRYVLRRRLPSYGPSGADWYVDARS